MVAAGYERDTLHRRRDAIRWWFYVETGPLRNQEARQGVIDRGFRFARGGRAETEQEAETRLRYARMEAREEAERWKHQPSHMLGDRGQLIPLDEIDTGEIDGVVRELEAAR